MMIICYLVEEIDGQPRWSGAQSQVLDLLDLVLEESGDVEHNRECCDKCDVQTGLTFDAVRVGCSIRTTNSDIAIHGHQHCQVDRTYVQQTS